LSFASPRPTAGDVSELSDSVRFEVADLAAAVRLTRRLAPTWTVSLQERRDVNLVSAKLRVQPDDLAVLLRSVEAWVEEESLCAIRLEIDTREYVLHAGDADWQSAPRALV
jgi:hypothetical protein